MDAAVAAEVSRADSFHLLMRIPARKRIIGFQSGRFWQKAVQRQPGTRAALLKRSAPRAATDRRSAGGKRFSLWRGLLIEPFARRASSSALPPRGRGAAARR